jgi:uncharacterized protein involved in exopolysaccharide biosynthesis
VIATQAMRGYVKTQMELIQDYRVAGEVVDKMGWTTNPAFISAYQQTSDGTSDIRRWAAQRIIDGTSVDLVENSSIMEISFQGQSPAIAKAISGALREAFIEASLRMRTDSAGRTADWYREQADKAQKSLAAAEAAKSNYEQENGLVSVAGGGDSESAKLQALQSALVQARSGQASGETSAATLASGSSPVVDQLKMQVATLNTQVEQAGEKFGASHPAYKSLLAQRALITSQLAREESAARAKAAVLTGASRRSAASLESDYQAQKAKVLEMQAKLDTLAQFQRDVDLRRSQYEKAAARTADLRLAADVAETGLTILGDPIAAAKPTYPNMPLITGLSVGFGLALGLALALVTELMARRVRGQEDLSFAAKVPVLAVIAAPRSAFRERVRSLLTRNKSNTPAWQPAQ